MDRQHGAAVRAYTTKYRRLVRLLDLAIERGDRLAIAVIETRLGFGYADRFMRQA